MSAQEALAILWRQRKIFIFVVISVLLTAALYVQFAPVRYSAAALIRVEWPHDLGESRMINPQLLSVEIEREAQLLTSYDAALSSVEAARAEEMAIEAMLQAEGAVVEALRGALSVKRVKLTDLVEVRAWAFSPDDAAALANLHAQTYLADRMAGRLREAEAALAPVEADIEALLAAERGAIEAYDDYVTANYPALSYDSGREELARNMAAIEASEIKVAALGDVRRAGILAIEARDWSAMFSELGNDALASFEARRASVMTDMTVARALGHDLRSLAAELSLIEASLLTEAGKQVVLLEDERSALVRDIDAQKTAQISAVRELRGVGELDRLMTAQIQARDALQRAQADHAQRAALHSQTGAAASVVSVARPPLGQSSPNVPRVLAFALVVGTVLAAGVSLIAHEMRDRITSISQLQTRLKVTTGAALPKVSGPRVMADLVLDDPISPFAEGLRKLRAVIDRRSHKVSGKAQVVLVTSAGEGEGKSTLALSLSRTYAQAQQKTLLIDADFYNPTVHKMVGSCPERGLSAAIASSSEQVPFGGVYDLDSRTDLDLLLGRGEARGATDQMLQSRQFRDLIERASEKYDVIVLDCPPVLPVVDVRYLAPMADVVVMLAHSEHSKMSDVMEAAQNVSDSVTGTMPIVPVLNAAPIGAVYRPYRKAASRGRFLPRGFIWSR